MRTVFTIASLLIKEIFRKKDFYVAFLLIAVILFYASQLEFYNERNIVRYLMEIGLALIFFFSVILTTALAARQVPSEIQNRTCYALLAKPVSRGHFLAGKFLGSFLAGSVCFFIFYSVFLVVVQRKAGSALDTLAAFQTFYFFLLNLMVVAAMASGLSYTLTTSANVSITLIFYILINTYGPGLRESSRHIFWAAQLVSQAVYYLLPHFEFFDMRQRFVHRWGPVPLDLVFLLTMYALVYTFLFLWLGWIQFRKRVL